MSSDGEFFIVLDNLTAFLVLLIVAPFYFTYSALGALWGVFMVRDGSYYVASPSELEWDWPKNPPKEKKNASRKP